MQRAADNGDEDAPALLEKYTKAAEAIKKIDSGDAQAQADLAGVLMALAGSLEQAGTTEDDYTQAFELATILIAPEHIQDEFDFLLRMLIGMAVRAMRAIC